MGIFSSFTGLIAYAPVKTPVFSLVSAIRSRSLAAAAAAIGVDGRSLLGGRDSSHQRMLRGQHHVGRAVKRVGAGREDGDARFIVDLKILPIRRSEVAVGGDRGGRHVGPRLLRQAVREMSKSTSAPTLLPIQFRCISFSDSRPVQQIQVAQQAIGIGGDAQHPLPHGPAFDGIAAALRFAVDDFFVGQHRSQVRGTS